jgi:predicted transcriptional regulator
MRTTAIMTVSLPPEMLKEFEAVRKAEKRTRSELVREALRRYFESRYPSVRATRAELAVIRRGRAAYERGDFAPLDRVLDEMESGRRRPRTETVAKNSAQRSRSH